MLSSEASPAVSCIARIRCYFGMSAHAWPCVCVLQYSYTARNIFISLVFLCTFPWLATHRRAAALHQRETVSCCYLFHLHHCALLPLTLLPESYRGFDLVAERFIPRNVPLTPQQWVHPVRQHRTPPAPRASTHCLASRHRRSWPERLGTRPRIDTQSAGLGSRH